MMSTEVDRSATTIIEYLDKNHIRWQPCNIEYNGSKKRPIWTKDYMPKPNDFIKISAQELKRRQSFIDLFDDIAIDTTQIYHIDVDMMPEKKQYPDCNWKFLDRIRTTLPYYESVTKKMPHAFVKASTKLKKTRQQILYDDIEILSGCYAFCKKNEIVHNSHVPLVAFDI